MWISLQHPTGLNLLTPLPPVDQERAHRRPQLAPRDGIWGKPTAGMIFGAFRFRLGTRVAGIQSRLKSAAPHGIASVQKGSTRGAGDSKANSAAGRRTPCGEVG